MGKLTIYNVDEESYSKVEEPDPSESYTYADYLKWQFEERLELFRGKIFKMSPAPAPVHQEVISNLNRVLSIFLKKKRCKVYPAPFDVRLPDKNRIKDNQVTTVVQPDLCVICDLSKIDERGCIGAPDLVIEVLSPGNSQKEIRLKFDLYEEAAVKEYWLVYPVEQSVAVFVLNEEGKYSGATLYAGKDKIHSAAVTGLIVSLTEIFSK